MAIAAGTIIDEAAGTLNDPDKEKWTEAELLRYLSEAQRAAVLLKPDVNIVTAERDLVAGSKQALPDDGYILVDVTRNLLGPGDAISPSRKEDLDRSTPRWHMNTFEVADPAPGEEDERGVTNFVYDIRNRRTFYVSPNPSGAWRVEIVYVRIPAAVTARDTEINLDDIYEPALLAYVLYRAFAKDIAAEGQSAARADMYLRAFSTLLLGREDESEIDIQLRQQIIEGDSNIGNQADDVRIRGGR